MIFNKEITESITLKFSELAREMNKKGEKIYSLGVGEPNFETPKPIVDGTIEALKNGYTRYSTPSGLFELRSRISEKLMNENKIDTSPENIIVTQGAKQAMVFSLMAILEPFDEIINIEPCFVSFVPQIKIAEPTAKISTIDLNRKDFSIDWKRVEEKITSKTKAIILNFPNNPTGKMLSNEDLNQIEKIFCHRNLYIISDEIYEKLNFSGKPHLSPASIKSLSKKVITINGFSKSYGMTGWRIGYLAADSHIINKVIKLQQHINTNTNTFVQKGAIKAFEIPSHFIDNYKKELSEKNKYLSSLLSSDSLFSDFVQSEGGLFAFLNISNSGMDSDTFAFSLLNEMKTAVTPGVQFGRNWNDYIRISLASSINEFKEGIQRVNDFMKLSRVNDENSVT